MSVFRIEKSANYTVMSNYHLREKEMSLKAKGLLSLMLSLPNDWDYTIEGLVSICKENISAIRTTLTELKKFGYLEIIKKMPNETNTGRIEYEYMIYEKPKQECKKQDIENLYIESQAIENPLQLNTNIINTNITNTNNKNIKKEKKETTKTNIDLILDKEIVNNELKESIYDFIKMRKAIKKPVTDIALNRLINKLNKLADNDRDRITMLENAIFHCWQDIYPLKEEEKQKTKYEYEITYTDDDFTPEQYDRLMRGEMPKEEMIQILKEKKNV